MRLFIPLAVLAGLWPFAGRADPLFDPLAVGVDAPAPTRPGRPPCAGLLPDSALTVTEVVDLALCNNPQTREVWANARFQAAQVGVARAAWLPGLDGKFSGGEAWSEGRGASQRSAALTLSWLLFDFGTRSASLENARQLLLAASATQDATVQAVFLAALQAYYAAQAARSAVAAAQEAERAASESHAAAQTRYQVGVATPADRLQARTAWSQASLNRIRAEGEARNALGGLANLMGFDAHQPLELADLPTAAPDAARLREVESLVEEARRRRPDLKAAAAQVEAARAGVEAARAAGLPTLALSAGPAWQASGSLSSTGGALGLTLNVPLFSGYATTYRVRAAEAQVELRGAQRERLARQIALDVWRAYQSLITAGQSLKSSADLVASAEESERVALGRYKAGVGSILDVLNAQSALAAARQQRIQANLDWNVQRAALAQAMGALDYGLLQGGAEGKP